MPNSYYDIWEENSIGTAIDAEKLRNYIQIDLNLLHKTVEGEVHHYKHFRKCKSEDFRSRKFHADDHFTDSLTQMNLCPDVDDEEEYYTVEGIYTNMTSRNSFSIDIVKCSEDANLSCKNDTDIALLLH